MAASNPLAILDLSEARFRIATIGAAVKLAFFQFGAGLTYAAQVVLLP